MALPTSFINAQSYFAAAVEFLQEHSWIFSESNTMYLKSGVLDCMPEDYKHYFYALPLKQLNTFPFVHEPLPNELPKKLLHFRQKLADLTPKTESGSMYSYPSAKPRHKLSAKKQHEIDELAAHINAYAKGSQLLIDLGAGLGYLSEALNTLDPNYLILGLEAEQQRVEAARRRCQQMLPHEASKSISYQCAYISQASRDFIERQAVELAHRNQQPQSLKTMAIIGLHACADLSISAMLLFLAMPGVKQLHIMPCCYHKLQLAENGKSFLNFPLSSALFAASAKCFNRPFLRLACQQTSARWRHCSEVQHFRHGQQMFERALAEAVCDTNDELVKPKTKRRKYDSLVQASFHDLQENYQLHSKHTQQTLPWLPTHKERYIEITERYKGQRGAYLAEALTCLQTAMQKLCENVVLYDRLCYLEELAAAQHIRLKAYYKKLLDEKLSPRCFVLIAEKLP